MIVRIRVFAMLRERAGRDELELELEDGATVGAALQALEAMPELGDLMARMPLVVAVNREYAPAGRRLRADDEIALIPPVSGGEEEPPPVHARVTREALSVYALTRAVSRPGAGAVVSFQGQTREVPRLDYEAYAPMAEERIRSVLLDCIERHGLEAAAAEHRVGTVALGESSVIVAVSAAHRAEAFAGAREAIDRIKAEAPIWKKEVATGGHERWIAGSPPLP